MTLRFVFDDNTTRGLRKEVSGNFININLAILAEILTNCNLCGSPQTYTRRSIVKMSSRYFRGILSQQPKTEWKCAYNELLSGIKDLPNQKEADPLSGPIRKKSKTVSQDSDYCSLSTESEASKTDKQRVRFTGVEETSVVEIPTCPTCLQVIAKDTKDFDSLMEKPVFISNYF